MRSKKLSYTAKVPFLPFVELDLQRRKIKLCGSPKVFLTQSKHATNQYKATSSSWLIHRTKLSFTSLNLTYPPRCLVCPRYNLCRINITSIYFQYITNILSVKYQYPINILLLYYQCTINIVPIYQSETFNIVPIQNLKTIILLPMYYQSSINNFSCNHYTINVPS